MVNLNINISNKNDVNAETLTTGWIIPSGTYSPQNGSTKPVTVVKT